MKKTICFIIAFVFTSSFLFLASAVPPWPAKKIDIKRGVQKVEKIKKTPLRFIEQCTNTGGSWNSSDGICECPEGRFASPASFGFGSGESPGTICLPTCEHEGQILNGPEPEQFQCVCDKLNFYRQSFRNPAYDDGSPRCVKRISDMKIQFRTGTIENSGTDDSFFLWIGKEELGSDVRVDEPLLNYLVIHLMDEGPLNLNRGDLDEIRLGEAQDGVEILESLSDFVFLVDDLHFLGIYPDSNSCDLDFFTGFSGFDGWYLKELKVRVKLEGEPTFRTIYHNTSVDEWIDYTSETCLRGMQSSKHTF